MDSLSSFLLYYACPTFAIAVLATFVSIPWVSWLALRLGFVQHISRKGFMTELRPTLGGVSLCIGFAVTCIAHLRFDLMLLSIILGGLYMSIWGAIEEKFNLIWYKRLLGELLGVCIVFFGGISIESWDWLFFNVSGRMGVLEFPLTALVILIFSNCLLPIRRIDGLTPGYVGMVSFFLAVTSFIYGQTIMALMAIAVAGTCASFFKYNRSPVRVLLGRSGTLFLGFCLGCITVSGILGRDLSTDIIVPIFLLSVPILFTIIGYIFSRRVGKVWWCPSYSVRNKRLNTHYQVGVMVLLTYIIVIVMGLVVVISLILGIPLLLVLIMMMAMFYGMSILGLFFVNKRWVKRVLVVFRG